MFGDFHSRDATRRDHSRHGHGSCSLDVVVKCTVIWLVLGQQAESVVIAEVLELD